MKRKLGDMLDVYGSQAKCYDYLQRILASFAEIYNYDSSFSSLMEDGKLFDTSECVVRQNGIMGRIRAFYEYQMNEEEIPTKLYYNEVVLHPDQSYEYGYLCFSPMDESGFADMISMAVRMLEAAGLHDAKVFLSCKKHYQKKLFSYLDCLDINYEEKDMDCFDISEDISFSIYWKKEDGEEIPLIQGGTFQAFTKKIQENSSIVFGFFGTLEALSLLFLSSQKLDAKTLDLVLTYDTEKELEHVLYLVQELRLNGFRCEFIKRCDKSFIKKYYPTKYVLSILEEDMKQDQILVTDLYTNEKEKVQEMDLIQHFDMNF